MIILYSTNNGHVTGKQNIKTDLTPKPAYAKATAGKLPLRRQRGGMKKYNLFDGILLTGFLLRHIIRVNQTSNLKENR
jgi:hypothetical protein